MDNITYKPYPICQFHRGIVRGLAALRQQTDAAMPGAIEIRMHPFEADFIGVRYAGPFTRRAQAFMSAPYLAAIAWHAGTVTFQALQDFDNPAFGETMARVSVIADPSRERYEPAIRVALTDGRTLEWAEAEGERAYDLTWASAVDSVGRLTDEAGIPASALAPLIDAVATVEGAPSTTPLMDRVLDLARAARF